MGFFGDVKDIFGGSHRGGGRGSGSETDRQYVETSNERADYYEDNPGNFTRTNNDDNNDNSFIDTTPVLTVLPKNEIKGKAPSGLGTIAGFTSPIGIMGKLGGWLNGLDPETQISKIVDGRQTYVNPETNFKYSYNFLKMPYEVVEINGKLVDALKIDASGKAPGDAGYDQSTNKYSLQSQKFEAKGDNDALMKLAEEERNNNNFTDFPTIPDDPANPEGKTVIEMAEEAGIIKNQADMQAIIDNPNKFLSDRDLTIADLMPMINADATGTTINPDNAAYGLGDDPSYIASTTGDASVVDTAVNPGATTYEAETSVLTDKELADAAVGTVSENAIVDAEGYAIDTTGAATGINEDGTTSVLGNALNDFASQDISKVIDTSTIAGKLLAQKLGEGSYTDSKATVMGQMKIISAEFKSSNGDPIIPAWAQGMARDASKSIAFSGISGTAAIAAMSNALMESTLGVAEKDAMFFQTLTTKNLDNRQQAIINKASVLSKLEMANLDVRSQAAVMNAKSFMEMDLKNLTNEQQVEIVNKQAFVQSMFDNTKAINAQRLFTAENTNEMDQFYSELNSAIQRHNTSETNALSQFNSGEINNASQFNADIKNDRQQFLSKMQYNIDVANAKWRQTVETTNNATMVEAHTTDVKNALDLNQEAQNNLWDSADNLLDYIWKTTDNDQERELRLLVAQLQAQSGQSSGGGFMDGLFKLGGAFLGSSGGSSWLSSLLPSDIGLKENIKHIDTIKGVNFYQWEWNEEGKRIGADQFPPVGVLAQEIRETHPEAVQEGYHGYLMVNYGMINNDI